MESVSMSLTPTQKWLRDNTKFYSNSSRVYADVDAVLPRYPTLRPKTDVYTYDDGRTQLLLCIHGLLSISYRQASYNIPIAVWLTRDYPREPPIAYVVATNEMLIRASKHVEISGRCNIDYLENWHRKSEGCNVLALLESMQSHFSREPPVYAKPRDPPPPPPPQLALSIHDYSARSPPPIPSNLSSPPAPARSTPLPAQGPDRPPLPPKPSSSVPKPPAPQSVPPMPVTTSPPPSHIAPYQQQHVSIPVLGISAKYASRPPPPPPPPSAIPEPPYPGPQQTQQWEIPPVNYDYQHHQQVLIPPPQNYVYQSPPQPPQLPPNQPPPPPPLTLSPPPPRNLLDEDTLDDGPTSSAPAPGLAPPRPPNPELVRLHSEIHGRLVSEFSSLSQAMALDAERLRAQQSDLLTGEPAIRDEMARLEAVRDVCLSVGARLRGVVEQGERNVAELKQKGDPEVDELVCSTTIVHNQLINLIAEDNAIEDTIYHLHRALNVGRIDLERFLRTTRVLAEEQFMKRALIEKIQVRVPMGSWS